MERQIIPFTTEEAWLQERTKDLTSSDIPILFNVGYTSYEKLFEAKLHGKQLKIESNEQMNWGKALQDSIAEEFARRNLWNIRKKTEYIRIPELRVGSSFDFELTNYDDEQELIEVKNIGEFSYKDNWIKGFNIQAPPYIELQIQNELLVSGLKVSYICALIGGNKGIALKREANTKIQEAILYKAKQFWQNIDKARREIK